MTDQIPRAALILVCVAMAAFANASWSQDSDEAPWLPAFASDPSTKDLADMRERGVIRALVTMSKTDFFVEGGAPKGLQAELLQHYEKFLNQGKKRGEVGIRIVYVPVTFDRLIPDLLEGKGDIAAALLTVTPEREEKVAFTSRGRAKVNEILITGPDVAAPDSAEDLSGQRVYVLRGSSYVEHLTAVNARLFSSLRPPIKIEEADPNLLTEDILEMVNAGVVKMTVCDDYKARLWAKVLPNLVLHESVRLAEEGQVGWAVRKDNAELQASLNGFLKKAGMGTLLGNVLIERYLKDTKWIKNPLADAERARFEKLAVLFERYGAMYDFNWLAIAAQAYQESGLNQSVRSPAGAVGIMQILPTTAAGPNVGIPDIEDLENNIHAGVKYMSFLRERYFSDPALTEEDRFAFSWAAYNAGPTKVRKMRARAEQKGFDPNRWFGNVEYAALSMVGRETVNYVSNIYKYYVAYSLGRNLRPGSARGVR